MMKYEERKEIRRAAAATTDVWQLEYIREEKRREGGRETHRHCISNCWSERERMVVVVTFIFVKTDKNNTVTYISRRSSLFDSIWSIHT